MSLTSDHPTASWVAQACAAYGIKHAVISPGSRNGPLTIAFNKHPNIESISISDERVAGFFALGMAQQLGAPIALICTSGSAVLNYAPACAEAFYQHIPLLFISADRPAEMIDIGDGQTIRQHHCLEPHVKASLSMGSMETEQQNAVLLGMQELQAAPSGPVHLNMPFSEPLYGTTDVIDHGIRISRKIPAPDLSVSLTELQSAIDIAQRIMVLAGQMEPSRAQASELARLIARCNATLLCESTSNVDAIPAIQCIDRVLPLVDEAHRPDLIITVGNAIVSKRIKAWLRGNTELVHWHIGSDPKNTFGHLKGNLPTDDLSILADLLGGKIANTSFTYHWDNIAQKAVAMHDVILQKAPFCDLKVFEQLLQHIPAGSDIHLANSTPVRYSQLFDRTQGHRFFSNRGTSGIDGCTSTAAGAAFTSGRITTLITGDVSFLYDSNGLWHHHLSPKLRIIVIDNGGGNIFRIIEGPDSTVELEEFFETPHRMDIQKVAQAYGSPTYFCEDEIGLIEVLPKFYADHDRPPVLVIRTEAELSPRILREYFKELAKA